MAEQGSACCGLVVLPFLDGRRAVVVVAGEADRATASRLRDQVIGSLGCRARSLVLDLTDLAVRDTEGSAALRGAVAAAQERGVAVSVRGPSPDVARVLPTCPSHR